MLYMNYIIYIYILNTNYLLIKIKYYIITYKLKFLILINV